jgi:hypothetical protein
MGKGLLKLPRRLFGYQASSVDQLIADRDSMLGMAEQRVRSAEARIAELQEELSRRDEDIEAVKARLEPKVDPAPAGGPMSLQEAVDEGLDDEADEVEEWPLPTIRPRTVEFTPRHPPAGDFDPMPIGGEDRDWSAPAAERWGAGEESTAEPDSVWGAPAHEEVEETPEATAWPPEDQGTIDEPATEPAVPQLTPANMSEELAHVVKAAEGAATRIIERAWESTRTQIEQVDRLWREVQEEIIRFAAWRQHVDPMISTVLGYVEQARASIEEVPPRIQEALSPAVEAMARVDEGMSEFAKASDLRQLLGKLHAEVANTIDTADATPDAEQAEPHEKRAREFEANDQSSANGDPRHEDEDMGDIAGAIAHELRIISESGDPMAWPDKS